MPAAFKYVQVVDQLCPGAVIDILQSLDTIAHDPEKWAPVSEKIMRR